MIMSQNEQVFAPSAGFSAKAHVKSLGEYEARYKESIKDPDAFWAAEALRVSWFKKWDKVIVDDFANAKHEWFVGSKLNVSYNCLDRHLKTWRKNKAATNGYWKKIQKNL